SCLAGSIKLHVFTTITSASEGCGVSSWPCAVSWPIITSVSTRFLGQPRLTNPIFKMGILNMAVRFAALFEILLMILFGAPELAGGDDLGHNRFGKLRLGRFARRASFH